MSATDPTTAARAGGAARRPGAPAGGRRTFAAPAVPVRALSGAEIEAWSDLAGRAAFPNPFFEPACQLPAAEHLAGDLDPHLVVATRGDELVACLPLCVTTSRRAGLRRRVGHTRLVSTPVGLGTPLLDGADPAAAAAALLEALRAWSRRGGPGIVVLDWLDADPGGAGAALASAASERAMASTTLARWTRPVVRRSAAGLSLGMSKERRRQLERRRRRLGEALGGPVELVDRAGDPAAVDDFLRLEASGWKGTDGDAYLTRPASERWFREACARFARAGRIHLLAVEAAGRTVAIQCALRAGGEAFFFRVGHDVDLARYAPGVLVQAGGVDALAGAGVDLVDSCADPGNTFLSELFPERRGLATVVLGTGGGLDRAAVTALGALQRARERRARRALSGAASAADPAAPG